MGAFEVHDAVFGDIRQPMRLIDSDDPPTFDSRDEILLCGEVWGYVGHDLLPFYGASVDGEF